MDEPTPQCLREEECDAVSKKGHKVQCPAKEVWYAISPTRGEVLRKRKDKEESKH
jgi:hypothetical protein